MTGHKVRPGLGAGAVDETGSESTALSASLGAESNVVSVIKVTDHNSLVQLLKIVRWKNLPVWYNADEVAAWKRIHETEIGDLVDDLKRLRAIATFRLSFSPPLTLCRPWTGTLYTASDYQLYFVIDNYNDLQYIIYFPKDNPSAVYVLRPLNIDDGANFYYGQIVNAVWLAVFRGYYTLLRMFAHRFDHRQQFFEILRRNKSEKTLRILDGWFWNFHHWLNTTGVLI